MLLCYQRVINLSQNDECFFGDLICYISNVPYDEAPLFNRQLSEMIKTRTREWAVIPDVFVSVPMQYRNKELIVSREPAADSKANCLLKDMDFRTQYEAGIPNVNKEVDDLASFKGRIMRSYLEKVKVQIASEASVEDYTGKTDPIGAAAYVDLFVSIDMDSDCAVLTWYSLSTPFLVSHLLDNIIRNQLQVVSNGENQNFFDYISNKYALVKKRNAKNLCCNPSEKRVFITKSNSFPSFSGNHL